MKKIKFRAWDKSTKRFVYSYTPSDQPKREKVFIEFGIGYSNYKTEDLVIQEYINCNDINNQEVYEGDLFREFDSKYNYLYEVYWDEKFGWSQRLFEGKQFMGSMTDVKYIVPDEMKYRVVGNIFELEKVV